MTASDVAKMAQEYLAKPGCEVGGSLHIVLDDGNLEDEHLIWCEGYASGKGDAEGERFARALRSLTLAQREALYEHDWRADGPPVAAEAPPRPTWSINESGWLQIGSALWYRDDGDRVELAAGREGGDHYAAVDRSEHPDLTALLDAAAAEDR